MIKFLILCFILGLCFFFFKDKNVGLPQGNKTSLMYAGVHEQDLTGTFIARNYSTKGLTNILVIGTRECPACKSLKIESKSFLSKRSDLSINFLYMPYTTWASGQSKNTYGIEVHAIPHTIIVDPKGSIIAEDSPKARSGTDYLYKHMRNER